jgi:hypothetical protein
VIPDEVQGRVGPPPSLRARAANLVNPYSVINSISLEHSLTKSLGATLSWDGERGIHLYRGRDINAPLPIIGRPDPTKKVVTQIESTGFSKSNNLSVSLRKQITGRLQGMMGGSYTLGYTNNNTDGSFSLPINNYDFSTEWGRSPQDTRHRFNMFGQIRLPWGVSTTTQVNWSSSRPYNIVTGCDDNLDSTINDRPSKALLAAFLAAHSSYARVICGTNLDPITGLVIDPTILSLLDTRNSIANDPAANNLIARNIGNGPGQFNVQMSFNKTVRLKGNEPTTPTNRAGNNGGNNFVEPQRGGGGGGFPGGGGDFGGGQRGGGDFGGQRGGGNRGNRGNQGGNNNNNRQFNQQNNGPTVTFNLQFQNLLNHTQLNGYSGTMTSPFFGKANNARNPRQIEAGLRLNF